MRPVRALAPLCALALACGALVASGCGSGGGASTGTRTSWSSPPAMSITTSHSYTATITTNMGVIVIALEPKAAPKTVNNFVFLSRQRFYDGLTFHRAVPGFVIQGGDPAGNGTGGPGYEFADELPKGSNAYPPGAVAMANSGPNTNGSQFFIVTGDASGLSNSYSRFGKVVKGLDVARRIAALGDVNPPQAPSERVDITSIRITERP
jgi:cyclophilin family peptidyl-prolyl cis-trans isomerase